MSNQSTFDKLDILGVEVDVITNQEAVDYIINHILSRRPAAYMVKPYVEFFDQAFANLEIQALLNQAELSLADGIAVQWAAAYLYAGRRTSRRWLTTLSYIMLAPHELRWPLTERAAGTNFTWPLLEAAARSRIRIALVGSPQHSRIEHVADTIRRQLPDIQIALTHNGTDPHEQAGQQSRAWLNQLAMQLQDHQADLILLGLGFPRQEFAAAYLAQQLKHGFIIGEGGTFDYQSFGGSRPKAPARLQAVGLEWLWRLALEPSRFRRQLAIPRFIWRIWRRRRT